MGDKNKKLETQIEYLNKKIGSYEENDKEKKKCKKLFKSFDIDNDGFINPHEFTILCKKLGKNITLEQSEQAVKSLDVNGDNEISFEEFFDWWINPTKFEGEFLADVRTSLGNYKPARAILDFVAPIFGIILPSSFSENISVDKTLKNITKGTSGTVLESNNRKKIRIIFERFDVDKSGSIDIREFKNLLEELGEADISDDRLKIILRNIDTDGNGTIEFDEFYIWWISNPANGKDADGVSALRSKLKNWSVANVWGESNDDSNNDSSKGILLDETPRKNKKKKTVVKSKIDYSSDDEFDLGIDFNTDQEISKIYTLNLEITESWSKLFKKQELDIKKLSKQVILLSKQNLELNKLIGGESVKVKKSAKKSKSKGAVDVEIGNIEVEVGNSGVNEIVTKSKSNRSSLKKSNKLDGVKSKRSREKKPTDLEVSDEFDKSENKEGSSSSSSD